MMAFGSMHAARKLGLKVPDDVAVVGFDDIALCAFVQPALTTVEIPRYGLGVGAMQMLIDLISGSKRYMREKQFLRNRGSQVILAICTKRNFPSGYLTTIAMILHAWSRV